MSSIKRCIFIIFIVMSIFLIGCSSEDNKDISTYSNTGFAMGTTISQQIYASEDLTEEIMDKLIDLEEDLISWRKTNSEIYNLNSFAGENKRAELSESTEKYLKSVLEISAESNGALDPTIGQIARLWDIGGENPRVPQDEEIEELLNYVGYKNIDINDEGVLLPSGYKIDLGAVGKGIGCDEARKILSESEKTQGAVISVGGSILVYGNKPDGEAWRIAITDPRGEDEGDILGGLTLTEECYISTSGDYEKYIEKDGKRYHHILDPSTGYPAESGLISVTIVCDNGLLSDALSTACFVLGLEEGMKLAEKYNAEAMFVDEDKNIYMTDGMEALFELSNTSYQIVNN